MTHGHGDLTHELGHKGLIVLTKRAHGCFAFCAILGHFVDELQTTQSTVAVEVRNRHAHHRNSLVPCFHIHVFAET